MPRKLKVFKTSIGFFDLAVAAPSRAAALRAWGANANLFQQGFAAETSDGKIAAAALAKPGIVLQRPVGSTKPFTEHAKLPTDLPSGPPPGRQRNSTTKPRTNAREKPRASAAGKADLRRERAHERTVEQRERQQQEQAEAKRRERSQQAVRRATAVLEAAERRHGERLAALDAERARLDRRSQAEEDRWRKEKEKLEAALRRTRPL